MAKHHKTHPPCWCVAPTALPLDGEPYEMLRKLETDLLPKGLKVRLVVFDVPVQIMGVAMFDARQRKPTQKQLARIFRQTTEFQALAKASTGGTA